MNRAPKPPRPSVAFMAALTAAGLALAASAQAQHAKWYAFSPPDGVFTVAMPAEPVASRETGADKGGAYVQRLYVGTGSGMAVVATVSDYQPSADNGPSLEAVRNGVVAGLKGELASSQAIGFPKTSGPDVPGLEFVFTADDLTCASDIYVDAARVDGVLACAQTNDEALPRELQVLQSFVLRPGGTDKPPEITP